MWKEFVAWCFEFVVVKSIWLFLKLLQTQLVASFHFSRSQYQWCLSRQNVLYILRCFLFLQGFPLKWNRHLHSRFSLDLGPGCTTDVPNWLIKFTPNLTAWYSLHSEVIWFQTACTPKCTYLCICLYVLNLITAYCSSLFTSFGHIFEFIFHVCMESKYMDIYKLFIISIFHICIYNHIYIYCIFDFHT